MWTWVAIAAVNGFLAVLLGAAGAHTLEGVDEAARSGFATGVRLHMWHALALLGVACLIDRADESTARRLRQAAWAFAIGVVGFSGPLYLAGLVGLRGLSWIVPVGGLTLLAGWLLLAWVAWSTRRGASS